MNPKARDALGLALVLALGLVLRAPLLPYAAASYRTTEAFNIEEVENVRISTGMVHESSPNPHAFEYPSLFYTLSSWIERPVRAAKGADWSAYLVAVRSLSLVFGLAAIALAFLLAHRLGGGLAGTLAGVVVATDRTMIAMSVTAKPNMAQVAFVLAGTFVLVALLERTTLRKAALAAAFFALATASKWLGALGLLVLALAGALAAARDAGTRGLSGLGRAVTSALRRPVAPWTIVAPLLAFAAVLLVAMPYALLSPKEFGFGLAQVFFAQGANRRPLPAWSSFGFLLESAGPVVFLLLLGGLAWGLRRALRWDGSPRASGVLLVLAWALGYGFLVTFLFARLPSYVDLWLPFLAVLAGIAWAGDEAFVRVPGVRAALVLVALAGGLVANGGYARSRAAGFALDTRVAAASWLEAQASPRDTLLADLGVLVPDSLAHVRWNAWGTPPRTFYDETQTWGHDPVWTDNWYGGHRRLVFVNARWAPPESLLLERPRFVVTTTEWIENRRSGGRSAWASADYDRGLESGALGYHRVARFFSGADGLTGGPEIRIYRREERATSPAQRP